jgi:uncharacterized ion transporter superfamily protein YfcC
VSTGIIAIGVIAFVVMVGGVVLAVTLRAGHRARGLRRRQRGSASRPSDRPRPSWTA